MPTMPKRNAFYAQSGGVTAVINASACGVIETALKARRQIGRIYAGRDGIVGALTESDLDTVAARPDVERVYQRAARNRDRAQAFAARWGYEDIESDWRKLISIIGANISPNTTGAVSKSNLRSPYPSAPITVMMPTSTTLPLTAYTPSTEKARIAG